MGIFFSRITQLGLVINTCSYMEIFILDNGFSNG